MKKSLILVASSLLLLGSCGGNSEPQATSTPSDTSASSAVSTKTSTKTSSKTSASQTSASSSKSSTPAPHTEHTWAKTGDGTDYQIDGCSGCELVSYSKPVSSNVEGTAYNSAGVLKLEKNASVSWKFTLPAGKKVDFYIGAQCSYDDHLDRYLFNMNKSVNPTNPVTGEPFEDDSHSSPDQANEDPWRYAVSVNGVDSPLKNGKTMRENGMEAGTSSSLAKDLYLTSFDLPAGENTITLTQKNIGFRTLFSGNVRLVITGDYEGGTPVEKSFAYGGIEVLEVESAPVLSISGTYAGYSAAEMLALPYHFDVESNEWYNRESWEGFTKYLADSGTMTAENGAWNYRANLTSLPVMGGFIVHFSINTDGANGLQLPEAFDVSKTIGNLKYRLANWPGAGDDAKKFWGNVALIISDPTVPHYEFTTLDIAVESEKIYTIYNVAYENYTAEQIVALDWQGAWQHNNNIDGKGWDYGGEWGNEKAKAFAFDTTEAGLLKIKMDVTDLEPAAYTGKMGIGLEASGDNAGHAHNASVTGENKTVTLGSKTASIAFGDNRFWGCPALFIEDSAAPAFAATGVAVVEVEGAPIFRISGTYENYEVADFLALSTYFDLETNCYAWQGNWNIGGSRKLVNGGTLTAADGAWKYEVDISSLDNFAYTTHFGINLPGTPDFKLTDEFDTTIKIGHKNYRLLSDHDNGDADDAAIFWGLVGLFITPEEKAVTFYDSSEQYTHCYIFGGSEALGSWPGTALTNHSVEVNLKYGVQYGVIFNNGSNPGQTPDMMVTIGDLNAYHYTSGDTFDEIELQYYSLTITTTDFWDNIYVWYGGVKPAGDWPGSPLVNNSYTIENIPEGTTVNFILSNSDYQTPDLSYTVNASGTIHVDEDNNITPANA